MLQRMNPWKKRILSGALALMMLLGSTPQPVLAAVGDAVLMTTPLIVQGSTSAPQSAPTAENPYAGKTMSILGDSISTYAGVSNNTAYNSTIGSNAVYYSSGSLGGQQETWWQQAIDALGMQLLVNNSWSGSCVLHPRQGAGSEGYLDRCVNLHNDQTGEEPDVIAVYLGANDFSYYKNKLGTADIDYDALIVENGDGTFRYGTPATTCEAYAIMLHKMTRRYPDAEIFCMTLLPRRAEDYTGDSIVETGLQPTAFNAELMKIITRFGAAVVNLEFCGITPDIETFDTYIADKRVHPNAAGMDRMTVAVASAMLGYQTELQTVTSHYVGVNSSNTASLALLGAPYRAVLTAQTGFDGMSVTVTMGGKDITADCYQNGIVNIPVVTGDLVLTAASRKQAVNYRWEFAGNTVIAVTAGGNRVNVLTKQAGTLADGVLQNACFKMAETVVLYHDRPWVVEWSAAGNWSGLLLSQNQSVGTEGNISLFKSTAVSAGLIAFGERKNSQYINHGVRLADFGVDTAQRHVYRVENRVAEDGSNQAYLLVDGVEMSAMNAFFIASTSQGSSANWVGGRDLTFNFIGASGHTMNNCDLDYLQVWEAGDTHAHAYTPTVTPPTCTEDGYTTYSCDCGDSYVADYVAMTDHHYQTGKCVECGAVDWQAYHYQAAYDHMPAGTKHVLSALNTVKTNKRMVLVCDVDVLNEGIIRLGHGTTKNYSQYLEVTADTLRVCRYYKGLTVTEYAHGLTLSGRVEIYISVGVCNKATVTIRTGAGEYTGIVDWSYGNNGELFFETIGVDLANVDCRWYCDGYNADVWLYGDSYFGITSVTGWTYHLLQDGYTDLLLEAYGGMGAQTAIKSFSSALANGVPQYAVWCMGMNNSDKTTTELNATWLKATEEFLSLCEAYGVTPILATIPSTPTVNNRLKNEWVRNSGYRYVDFDYAMVADPLTGDWYDGFIRTDNVHPAAPGAEQLYLQVLLDIPEICAGDRMECQHKLRRVAPKNAHCEMFGCTEFWLCTLCGGTYADADGAVAVMVNELQIPAIGHAYGTWEQVTAPACNTEGQDKRICTRCGDVAYRDTRISGDPNKILVSNPVDADHYAGKKLLLIGDSITCGVGVTDKNTQVYGQIVGVNLNMTVTNKGASGSGYCSGGAMATNRTLTEANVRNADVITIMLGVNDWNWAVKDGSWNGKPGYYDASQTYYQLGNFNSTDPSTFYGALHSWCQSIVVMKQLAGFEDKEFIVITPLITSWNISIGQKNWNQEKLNIHGHLFREYCTAIMEVCAHYDIPVFDANMFSGIYYNSAEDNNVAETGGDGVHVNAAGHALLAAALEEFLLEGYTYEIRAVADCGHAFESTVTAPTCTEAGVVTYRCSKCHHRYVEAHTPATGHSFTRYTSDNNATLYADGTKTALCDRGCGAKDTVTDVGSMLFPEQVTSQVYTIVDDLLTDMPTGTTVQTLLSGLDWGKYCAVYSADGQPVAADAAVGTGMVLKLQQHGMAKQTLTVIVTGDTNGDGAVTDADLAQVQTHLLQAQLLTGAYAKAADYTGDGCISITDVIRLQAVLLQCA